jgi:chromosome segregation ATPase
MFNVSRTNPTFSRMYNMYMDWDEEEMEAMQKRLSALESSNADLQRQVTSLNESREHLVQANQTLMSNLTNLQTSIAALSDRYDAKPGNQGNAEYSKWLVESHCLRNTTCKSAALRY